MTTSGKEMFARKRVMTACFPLREMSEVNYL